ncbi:hypothetical protein DMC63_39175 [Streptomyces sp. WAC 05977]|nr:hypothetical protein DMC63_39175 [Streptomyces sp. WAC 05977]
MGRSKLTIAAEAAGIGALLIAITALVVVIFFDTGVKMPWAGDAQPTLNVIPTSSHSSPVSTPQQAPQAEASPASQTTDRDMFWTSAVGLCFAAIGAFFAMAAASAVVSWLLDVMFIVSASFGSVAVFTPTVSAAYLWYFWPSLSSFGVILFLVAMVLAAFFWASTLDSWIL